MFAETATLGFTADKYNRIKRYNIFNHLKHYGGLYMSVEQYQRELNKLDEEISKLHTKKANIDSDVCKLENRILSIRKSINKNTSATTLTSKAKQIENLESTKAKKSKESADVGSKIAQKTKKRNEVYSKLQKEQQNEAKKAKKQEKAITDLYEKRINDLQSQLLQNKMTFEHQNISIHESNDKYDCFVSHAYEDKVEFVDEFVEELKKLDIKVWYDTDKLKLGDSMRKKIDIGLSKSKYGIVVLSPNYIKDGKYWTAAELNGLFQMESIGRKIIPIWHKLSKKEIMEYSPMIADKKAANTTDMTASEIAVLLKELLDDENND